MKIINYILVTGVPSIQTYLSQQWQPYGNPVITNFDSVTQVMVKYEETKSPEVISKTETSKKSKA